MSEQQDQAGSSDEIVLGNRYAISPRARLANLDSPTAEAYGARDRMSPDRRMFALICAPGLPARMDALKSLSAIDRSNFVTPEKWGIVIWPATGKERLVVVFEQPGGGRVVADPSSPFEPFAPADLIRSVIRPVVPILEDLSSVVVTHRAMRADNLFYADETRSSVVLGECVSAPPAYSQPVIYETVESAMAMPAGRGAGDRSDDLYALGVLLVVLLFGGDPFAGMTAHDIITRKIEKGSYAALLGQVRLPGEVVEPIRGLLNDDPSARWDAEDLMTWLDGRKVATRQTKLTVRTARPFNFMDEDYWTLRSLGHAMNNEWAEARKVVYEDRFVDWIERNLPQKDGTENVAMRVRAILSIASGGEHGEDQTLSRMLMALDPSAPIRFRDFSCMPESLGQALALGFAQPNMTETLTEVIDGRLVSFWLEMQPAAQPIFVQIKKSVDMMTFFKKKQGWGFGYERILYQLNPTWACQSPIFDDYIVCDARQLMNGLERIASQGVPEFDPVDSHVAAFCAARLGRLPDGALASLADAEDRANFRVGMLRVLATVQHLSKAGSLPSVGRWMARLMSPVIESFHNRAYRQRLGQRMEELARQGDLVGMHGLVDGENSREQDELGFKQAKALFAKLEREIKWLEAGGLTGDATIVQGSRQAAMLLSAILSGITLILMTLLLVT